MSRALEAVFWICATLVVYHYAAYPALIRFWAALKKKTQHDDPGPVRAQAPSLTVIVPAYNERAIIARKIRNLAALEYPAGQLTVVVALDGCKDDTETLARQAILDSGAGDRVELRAYAQNRGKVKVVNEEVGRATTEIVALNDASAMLEPDALVRLVRHFARSEIGLVCPTYALETPGSPGEAAYWEYQRAVKEAESAIASPIGPHGACYLFRRSLWTPLEHDVINDDFVMPVRMMLGGARAVYDSSTAALEVEPTAINRDFRRRIRIGAGNLQQIFRTWRIADPRRGATAFLYVSGKALRGLSPLLALAVLLASAALALGGSLFFQLVFALEVVGLALAALTMTDRGARLPTPLPQLGYFVGGVAASTMGCLLLIAGSGAKAWKVSNAGAKDSSA